MGVEKKGHYSLSINQNVYLIWVRGPLFLLTAHGLFPKDLANLVKGFRKLNLNLKLKI